MLNLAPPTTHDCYHSMVRPRLSCAGPRCGVIRKSGHVQRPVTGGFLAAPPADAPDTLEHQQTWYTSLAQRDSRWIS
jgi:hypothetical protein